VRVILAEDSGLLREVLSRALAEHGAEIVAAVDTPAGLHAAAEQTPADVYVVDVRMPPTFTDEGIRAALELRRRDSDAKVLVLSQYVEERYARELIADRADGLGYLLKDRVADVREFVGAVERVAAGGTALDPEVVRQLLVRRPADALTPRERDVLQLMAEGRSNAGIARALVITDGAVEKHIRNIFATLRLPPSDADHRRVLAVLTWLGEM
jgi:DNA-binding NarL/FixJ family response regulator